MYPDKLPLRVVYALTASSISLLSASYLILLLASLMLLIQYHALFIGILLCTVAQHYLYIRVQFDRKLLAHLFESTTSLEIQTEQLDAVLFKLRLIPQEKTARAWNLRLNGMMRLFKLQCWIIGLQFLFFLAMSMLAVN